MLGDMEVVDKSGVFISLNVKVPKGISGKVRWMNTEYRTEVGVIVVNILAIKEKNILYSRKTGGKLLPIKYNPKKISNYRLMKALDFLEKEEYIINTIAPRDYGYNDAASLCSSFIGTEKLYSYFYSTKVVEESKHTVLFDSQRIVVKDKDKNMIDYDECDITEYSRKCLLTYNQFLSEQTITYEDEEGDVHSACCSLTRIFNIEVSNTGRLYRSEIINIKSHLREDIKINGMSTVEIDFSSLHLRMLLDKYGFGEYIDIEQDAYLLPLTLEEQSNANNRAAIKYAFNIMLNNSKRQIACMAIQSYLNKEGALSDFKSANELLSKIEEAYSFLPLEVILWQSKPLAYVLQRLDSDIALEVISAGVEDGVVVLPIHDSFIVQSEHKNWLQDMMGNTYRKHLRTTGRVPVSVNFKGTEWKELA